MELESLRDLWRKRLALQRADTPVFRTAEAVRRSFAFRTRWARVKDAAFRAWRRQIAAGIARAGAMGDGAARRRYMRAGARAVYPLLLWGLPPLLVVYGARTAGAAAAIGAVSISLAMGGKTRFPGTAAAGVCLFLGALAVGSPRAVYGIATEACIDSAADRATGDVRTMADPRLDAEDRRWIARATAFLDLGWPDRLGTAPNEATLANIVVNAPVVISEIRWRGPNLPLTGLGLWEAKEAYAARTFDRRRACQLFHNGDHSQGAARDSAEAHDIAAKTDGALALILPALQATYLVPAEESQLADAGQLPTAR